MNIEFPIKSELALKVWQNFERELLHKLKVLPSSQQDDIRLEILSHLFDSASADSADTEEARLINAIARLGSPESYLSPLVDDILLSQQAAKGNPKAVLRGLWVNLRQGTLNSVLTVLFGFAYFSCFLLFTMAILHLFLPEVGLWIYPDGDFALSFESQSGAQQWRPELFTLVTLIVSVSLYMGLNQLLRPMISSVSKAQQKSRSNSSGSL